MLLAQPAQLGIGCGVAPRQQSQLLLELLRAPHGRIHPLLQRLPLGHVARVQRADLVAALLHGAQLALQRGQAQRDHGAGDRQRGQGQRPDPHARAAAYPGGRYLRLLQRRGQLLRNVAHWALACAIRATASPRAAPQIASSTSAADGSHSRTST